MGRIPKVLLFKIFLVLFFIPSLSIPANANSQPPSTAQDFNSLGVRLGLLSPAPSWIGLGPSLKLNPVLEGALMLGWSEWFGLRSWSISPQLRAKILDTSFSPVVGGGLNLLLVNGVGQLQGIDGTILIANLILGLDWDFSPNFTLSGGCQFHFPVKLIFPYLETRLSF